MKIKQITENTTSGSIATVETTLGGTQSRGNPSIYGGKKVGTLFKGKKTSAPYANSINESAELSEAHLEEDDVIIVPGQGRSRKNGLVPHGQSRLDHEVEMARSDLFSAAKNAQQVYSMIKDVSEDEGLDGWVQEKIIKANDYLNTIREYLEGKQVQGVAEGSENDISWMSPQQQQEYKSAKSAAQSHPEIWKQYQHYSIQDLKKEFPNQPDQELKYLLNVIQHGLDSYDPNHLLGQGRTIRTILQWKEQGQQGVTEGEDGVDSLVTDTEAVMKKFKIDALPALKIVLGEREYKDRPGYYNSFIIKQIIARSKQQGMAEGSRNAYLKHNNLVDIEKPLAGLKSEFEKFLQTHDPKEKQKYQQGIKQRIKSDPMSGPKGVLPEQGVAEGYDSVESDYQQWEDILVKDGYRGDPSGAYSLKLVVGHQGSDSDWVSAIRNILAYVKQNRQVLSKAVSDRKTVKDAIIDIKNEYPQLYQAAQQPQGMAEGVADMHSDELLNTVRDAIRKAIKETGDQSLSKIFVCLRSAIPASEALKNITSPISLEAVDNALQEVGIDFDDLLNFINKQAEKYGKQGVAEGAKVDRMVKHVAQSEKKLGKSKDEAENIAWATANKRGMLDNKNKKA